MESMDKIQDWGTPFFQGVVNLMQDFLSYLPQIFGAALFLIAGWIVARLARALCMRLLKGIGRFSLLVRITSASAKPNIGEGTVTVVGNIVFWIIILFFLTFATNILGMSMFTDWLSELVTHLPNIISGVLIICVGIIFGNLANQAAMSAALNVTASQRVAMARGAQFFITIMLVLIGVDQIGVDITAIIIVISVVVGALLTGLAIAFGTGARALVSNLIGIRYLSRDYSIGEMIKIGDYEGVLMEVTSVSVVIDTADGRVTIPAQMFSDQPSTLVIKDKGNDNE